MTEHHAKDTGYDVSSLLTFIPSPIKFKDREEEPYCILCSESEATKRRIYSSYFVGCDWLEEGVSAVYVQSKLNSDERQIDILRMIIDSMSNPDTALYLGDMFEVKPEKTYIELPSKEDFVTPLLMLQFLNVVKSIVRKGLKRSYYPLNENLYGTVKGKILVAQTIKHNLFRGNQLATYCEYNEFGVNSIENRLIKKALIFVHRYLSSISIATTSTVAFAAYLSNMYNFINPAFQTVNDDVQLSDVKHAKFNAFYKEYKQGIDLAKIILHRFGYNINNIDNKQVVSVPPFWIDMTKLFEVYILAQLKKRYQDDIEFQFKCNAGFLDYVVLSKNEPMIVDAKYKPRWEYKRIIDDIRQVSAYARDTSVTDKLGIAECERNNLVPDCLIIYSNQETGAIDISQLPSLTTNSIKGFVGFYRLGVKLPEVGRSSNSIPHLTT